jgi:hypothetical protein
MSLGYQDGFSFKQIAYALLKRSVKIQPDIGAKKQEEITN